MNQALKQTAVFLLVSIFTQLVIGPVHASEKLATQQVLHRGNGSEPQSLDPHKSEGVPSANIQRDLYEGLICESASGELVPGVAQSWKISKDGTRYVFQLRTHTTTP